MTSPRTGPDGRFSVRLPGGVSSRTLRLAYRSQIGDALPVATRTLTLSVRAGIALSVSPRVTGVGQSIFFRGRLLGGPDPPGGKQLVLEARSPGSSWIEFKVIRATRGPLPGELSLQVRGAGQLPVPRALRTGVRLPVRCGVLGHRRRAGAGLGAPPDNRHRRARGHRDSRRAWSRRARAAAGARRPRADEHRYVSTRGQWSDPALERKGSTSVSDGALIDARDPLWHLLAARAGSRECDVFLSSNSYLTPCSRACRLCRSSMTW